MEKAAEVYTRLKSRVLGPKIEAIQKAARTGAEKERAEVKKAEEALAGDVAPLERAEDEASAGEALDRAHRSPPQMARMARPVVALCTGLTVSPGQLAPGTCTCQRCSQALCPQELSSEGGCVCAGQVCVSNPG